MGRGIPSDSKAPSKERRFDKVHNLLARDYLSGPEFECDENDLERRFYTPLSIFDLLCSASIGTNIFVEYKNRDK